VSTLIIGGLFALAVVALVALAFVVRGESRTSQTPKAPIANEQSAPTVAAARQQAEASAPATPVVQNLPVPEKRDGIVPVRTAPARAVEKQRFPIANGQFHELSVELHTLHGQAQEIEHRLSILTEMIERIERSQGGRTSVAEEISRPTDAQHIN